MQERRAKVAKLRVQGYEQHVIAQMLGCGQTTVFRDLKALTDEWRASATQDVAVELGKAFAEYELVRREAWGGWERSKQVREITTTEATEGAGKPKRKASVRKEGQAGDTSFLTVIIHAREAEVALRGLMPPTTFKLDLAQASDAQLLRLAQGEAPERVLAELAAPTPTTPMASA